MSSIHPIRLQWPSCIPSCIFLQDTETTNSHTLRVVSQKRLLEWLDMVSQGQRRIERLVPEGQRQQASFLLTQARTAGSILWASEVYAARPIIQTHADLGAWCAAEQWMLQSAEYLAVFVNVLLAGQGLSLVELVRFVLPICQDTEPSSTEVAFWCQQLDQIQMVAWEDLIPALEPQHFEELVHNVWTHVRLLGGPRLVAPEKVSSARAVQRELDRVVEWCQHQQSSQELVTSATTQPATIPAIPPPPSSDHAGRDAKEIDSTKPDDFLEFPTKQRKLLTALRGGQVVPIETVLKSVYGSKSHEKLEALDKLKDRTNKALCEKQPEYEIKRTGNTLQLICDSKT